MSSKEHILVIRLGALGDIVLCFQAFHDIRAAHPEAEIALLTMPAFAAFAEQMPWFDRVIVDERASALNIGKWIDLVKRIRAFSPTRVYDLQGKFRQTILYTLLGGPPAREWSGAAPLCSHPRLWPPQSGMHFTDFIAAQLQRAGVTAGSSVDLSWLRAPVESLALPQRFVVLIPSCAKGREYKRWPVRYYAELAQRLHPQGIECVVVGTAADRGLALTMRGLAPHLIDVTGKTDLPQLAELMRRSLAVLGNDTGPTHLAGALGVPVLALLSERVNPVWSCPKGTNAHWLQSSTMSMMNVDKVSLALQELLPHNA